MTVLEKILVPDIGGATGVDVIELLVKSGDVIEKDMPLITLESDKATMEIPSPVAGIISELKIKIGDKVSEGDEILTYQTQSEGNDNNDNKVDKPEEQSQHKEERVVDDQIQAEPTKSSSVNPTDVKSVYDVTEHEQILAGPAARRLAHSLGVNLADVSGSGRKSRVSKEDIEIYVKQRLANPVAHSSHGTLHAKDIDFTKFGEVEKKPLNKIKKLTGQGVYYSWNTIPHVTQFDEADITDLEAFRKSESLKIKDNGYKLTILAFVCKVISRALNEFPQFNSSLDVKCENIIYKKYCNIGIAVETENGLVVPVIKNVLELSVTDIAKEMGRLSEKARDKGLAPADMMGGTFTISSLGGIGGTAFTPIVNSPEVAILGLSRSSMKPIFKDGDFIPRLMLPLSLSYDHRVIDGAEAARFTRYICECLSDLRRVLL